MIFCYPQSLLTPRQVDEMYNEEAEAFTQAGCSVSRIDSEKLTTQPVKIKPLCDAGSTVVYRGWMMAPNEYINFEQSVKDSGGQPFITSEVYQLTHYLPNWYGLIKDLTPETTVLPLDADWSNELANLGWDKFFVKDYVKSLKTSVGSVIEKPDEIQLVAEEMKKFRGSIEGGLCIRRVENFLSDTEQRYFVINGNPYAANPLREIPEIVFTCADRVRSPFFSVDVVQTVGGDLRVVEIGDGQVSDLVGWSVDRFVELWESASSVE
jgi:hypothetical protein